MKFCKVFFVNILIILFFSFSFNNCSARTDIFSSADFDGAEISHDTIWTKDAGPYVIQDDLVVDSGATLTIEPGAIIKLGYGVGIKVYGKLIADGTESERIYFTSKYDDSIGGDIDDTDEDYSTDLKWDGISFLGEGSYEISYANLSYAEDAIWASGKNISLNSVKISDCGDGLYISGSTINIENSYFNNISEDVIYSLWSDSAISISSSSIENSENGLSLVLGKNSLNLSNLKLKNIRNFVLYSDGDSTINIDNSNIEDSNTIFNIRNSSVNMTNTKIKNSSGIFNYFDSSSLNVSSSIIDNNSHIFGYFPGSIVNIKNTKIENSKEESDYFGVLNSSSFTFSSSSIINSTGGSIISFFNFWDGGASTINIVDSVIDGGTGTGLQVYQGVGLNIKNTKIKNFSDSGIEIGFNPLVQISDSEISGNSIGIENFGINNIELKNNVIKNNSLYGVYYDNSLDYLSKYYSSSTGEYSKVINATGNWWGDVSGPYNATSNPSGLGNAVSDNVTFTPWLKSPPGTVQKKNPVIIVPGIMGSYLNENSYDNKEVWLNLAKALLPGDDSYLDELALDELGQPDLTQSVLLPTDIFRQVGGKDFFDGLIKELKDNGYVENEDLFVFPYDWRLDIRESVDNLYSPLLTTLKDKIDQVLAQTGAEKVDIVAHSMGGLLSKYYIEHYGKDKVDKFVDIATPHLGTPSAFKVLMYGDNMGVKFKKLELNSKEVEKISQNMPSVYQLLPSQNYFSTSSPGYNYYVYDMNDYDSNGAEGELSFNQMGDFIKNIGHNLLVMNSAINVHNDIDNVNPADYGVKTYNIVGCKTPTIGKIFALSKNGDKDPHYDVEYISGDGTVPERSAEAVPSLKQFYVLNAEHATMPSSSGVKELVNSILSDDEDDFNYASSTNISTTSDNCRLPDGIFLGYHSPVELNIYDEAGNHTGPNENGDLEENIPGIAYDIIDGNKFAYLPDGQNYRIELKATSIGTFSSHIKKIQDGNIISVDYFNDLPLLSTSTRVKVDINSPIPVILLDQNGDGIFESTPSPSAILASSSIGDLIPPQTENSVSSDGIVSLSATDDNAGVLKTEYSFDGNIWNMYTAPFSASGKTVSYFSTDNAGNIEQIQSVVVPNITRKSSGSRIKINIGVSTSTATSALTIEVGNKSTNTNQLVLKSIKILQNNQLTSTSSVISSTTKISFQVMNPKLSSNKENKNSMKILSKSSSIQKSSTTSTSNIESIASIGSLRTDILSIVATVFQSFWSHLFLLFKKI